MSRTDIEHPIKIQMPQHQSHHPGSQAEMTPAPRGFMENYKAAGKLEGKIALITGGDSGIGRAIAIGMAMEGADIAIVYLEEDDDAEETKRRVEAEGCKCLLIEGDISNQLFCREVVADVIAEFGGLNILVNNAGQQYICDDFAELDMKQMEKTFRTNIFPMFYLAQAALPHLHEGDSIINTASITAYQGQKQLVDYSATKGAVVTFTRSLALQLADKNVRVNAVAPGPIWTPLIPSSFGSMESMMFGKHTTMGRAGQPDEVAPCYIFLASDDASYITGQVLHPNGGSVVNA